MENNCQSWFLLALYLSNISNPPFKRCVVNTETDLLLKVYCFTFQQFCNIIFKSAPLLQDISGTGLDKCNEKHSKHRVCIEFMLVCLSQGFSTGKILLVLFLLSRFENYIVLKS